MDNEKPEVPDETTPGKHPERALSAIRIRNATPGRHADGNGLHLVVDPSGAKRWILRVMVRGRRSDIGLGSLSLVSLAEAREEAVRLRKIARDGGDPLAQRRNERRIVPTFEQVARKVHENHSKGFRNAKHAAQWITTLETYAFPVFGSRPVDKVESADVLKALSPIWTEKPETARRVRQRMKTIFAWAKASGFRAGDNPVDGVSEVLPKHSGKPEHYAALPYVEVPAFLEALRASRCGIPAKFAFEFLILTAARTSEVLLASWSEFELELKTWTVPSERMKAKVEHRVPLSGRCLEILADAREISGEGEYVFPGRSLKGPLSNMTFEMALRRMGRTDITPHGFRSSFRDWAEEKTNFASSVIEASLAHTVRSKVEAAYLRTTLFEKRRRLMDAWAAFATAKPGARIVKIRQA